MNTNKNTNTTTQTIHLTNPIQCNPYPTIPVEWSTCVSSFTTFVSPISIYIPAIRPWDSKHHTHLRSSLLQASQPQYANTNAHPMIHSGKVKEDKHRNVPSHWSYVGLSWHLSRVEWRNFFNPSIKCWVAGCVHVYACAYTYVYTYMQVWDLADNSIWVSLILIFSFVLHTYGVCVIFSSPCERGCSANWSSHPVGSTMTRNNLGDVPENFGILVGRCEWRYGLLGDNMTLI